MALVAILPGDALGAFVLAAIQPHEPGAVRLADHQYRVRPG
jgi:hypothetical protein